MKMAGYLPHRIPHDFKHQSRGDFEAGNKLKKPSPYRDGFSKGNILSDDDSTLVASSKGSSYGEKSGKPGKSEWYPYQIPPPDKPRKQRRLCLLWLIPIVLLFIAIPVAVVILVKR